MVYCSLAQFNKDEALYLSWACQLGCHVGNRSSLALPRRIRTVSLKRCSVRTGFTWASSRANQMFSVARPVRIRLLRGTLNRCSLPVLRSSPIAAAAVSHLSLNIILSIRDNTKVNLLCEWLTHQSSALMDSLAATQEVTMNGVLIGLNQP
ncbi:hypothetical protein YC2023_041383 [Brassica napus]